MAKIVIKKKISLEFLGEEYKDAYLVFRTIPMSDYKSFSESIPEINPKYVELINKIESGVAIEKDREEFLKLRDENSEANAQSHQLISETLVKYFYSGKFPDDNGKMQDLTEDDAQEIVNIDKETAVTCFQILSGQVPSPKA